MVWFIFILVTNSFPNLLIKAFRVWLNRRFIRAHFIDIQYQNQEFHKIFLHVVICEREKNALSNSFVFQFFRLAAWIIFSHFGILEIVWWGGDQGGGGEGDDGVLLVVEQLLVEVGVGGQLGQVVEGGARVSPAEGHRWRRGCRSRILSRNCQLCKK